MDHNLNPTICGILLGGLWQVLVVFGLHWGIVPLGQINLAMYGRNTINAVTGPSNWAQAGAALGVALKSKKFTNSTKCNVSSSNWILLNYRTGYLRII
ncbi:MAG: hypothetical protein ACLRQF_02255 [Thomasclavelia ramosa]